MEAHVKLYAMQLSFPYLKVKVLKFTNRATKLIMLPLVMEYPATFLLSLTQMTLGYLFWNILALHLANSYFLFSDIYW